jgi:hypothetical protein
MALGKLGLSDDQFWFSTTPKKMHAMLAEWRKIKIGEYKLEKYILDGGEIEEDSVKESKAQEADARFL